ncbi:hypothetical protein [Armatimonas rosea]|uniref:Uncharacterized protein n=1 Tax=Armatimonas rosea TaxID=685828 RepID=A0A7W9SS38_ARMRO|nr:hypothetical protein [Armatimonas rosea]MBB6051837.1 hypothetical protein [Armatimonas rosea]
MVQQQQKKPEREVAPRTIVEWVLIVFNFFVGLTSGFALAFAFMTELPYPWYNNTFNLFLFIGLLLGGTGALFSGLFLLISRSARVARWFQLLGMVGGASLLATLLLRTLQRGIPHSNIPALSLLLAMALYLLGAYGLCKRASDSEE